MDPLDGNAIAGPLFEHFGNDMTAVVGRCRNCGRAGPVAELRVYTHAPGAVARCSSCGAVVMVVVSTAGESRVHLPALELAEPA